MASPSTGEVRGLDVRSIAKAYDGRVVAGVSSEAKADIARAAASDVISHIKIELPTTQLAAASTLLASLQLI